MPTREYKRIWCKTCNEFELHSRKSYKDEDKDLICRECGTIYTDVFLKDIPEEKIIEQRKRYKESERKSMEKFLSGSYLFGNPLTDLFKEPGYDTHITESDAGQRAIDEAKAEERRAKWAERQRIRDEERAEEKKFRGLGRNDICLCGSGKKYKKCCWSKIEQIQR